MLVLGRTLQRVAPVSHRGCKMNRTFEQVVVSTCGAALVLAGCATASKDIAPTYVSPMQYQSYDCDQIAAEVQRISARVNQLGGRLDEASNNDKVITTVGVILFWPILFALGGTKQQEAEYARLKGEYDALEQQAVVKKCPGAMPPATTTAGSGPGPAAAPAPAGATPSPAPGTAAATATSAAPVVRVSDGPGTLSSPSAANAPTGGTAPPPQMIPVSAPAPALANQAIGTTTPGVAATVSPPPSSSKWLFTAERFAKGSGCDLPVATMNLQTATSESFTITCSNHDPMLVRCGGDACRELQ